MVWLLLAVLLAVAALVALAAAIVYRGGPAHARLFPYYATAGCRTLGYAGLLQHRLGIRGAIAPEETFRTLAQHCVVNFARIAQAYTALDALPTVQRGLRALGLRSALDAAIRRGRLNAPGLTHPLQRPYFFVPGIPARTFYAPEEVEAAACLERAFPVVRQELLDLLASQQPDAFREYSGEFGNIVPGWGTFNLFLLGERVEENCARCPRTAALVDTLPRVDRLHIMFSALNAGAHIGRHFGPMNGMLRVHLPLIVTEGCGLRVGDETRGWEEGRAILFDDSFEHEVWNYGGGVRVVLFLSVWHPCLAEDELRALERLRAVLSSEILLHGEWKLRQQRRAVTGRAVAAG
jgi:aspartyl/asparaginyl beta-hydroxylase (cupin superfamily)